MAGSAKLVAILCGESGDDSATQTYCCLPIIPTRGLARCCQVYLADPASRGFALWHTCLAEPVPHAHSPLHKFGSIPKDPVASANSASQLV